MANYAEVAGQRATLLGALGTQTKAFPNNVSAGSLLVVMGCGFLSGGAAAPTVTDTRGTSYTVLSGIPFTNGRIFIAVGIAPSSGANTVQVAWVDGSTGLSWSIDEFSGAHATPLDVDGGVFTDAVGSLVAIDNIVTATPNALILGVMAYDSASSTITPGAGYTQIGEEESNTRQAHAAEFQIVTSSKLYFINWTLGTSSPWGIYVASFRPAAGSSGAGDPGEAYLLESGGVDHYLLEDGSGDYLLESATAAAAKGIVLSPGRFPRYLRKRRVI